MDSKELWDQSSPGLDTWTGIVEEMITSNENKSYIRH